MIFLSTESDCATVTPQAVPESRISKCLKNGMLSKSNLPWPGLPRGKLMAWSAAFTGE
jgi:hypothetical protein